MAWRRQAPLRVLALAPPQQTPDSLTSGSASNGGSAATCGEDYAPPHDRDGLWADVLPLLSFSAQTLCIAVTNPFALARRYLRGRPHERSAACRNGARHCAL